MENNTHTMMTYINQEPSLFTKILNEYQIKLKPFIDFCQHHDIKRCLILATGSSFNAALCAKYCFENKSNIIVEIKEPFNFNYYEKLDQQVDLVIAISQSGKSASTIESLDKIKAANIPIFALTANLESPICSKADYILDINCGIETVGFVTKGFLMTVLNLELMALIIAKHNQAITLAEYDELIAQLSQIGEKIPQVIEQSLAFFNQHQISMANSPRFIAIGYGALYGVTKEFETKFTETVRLPSTGYELEAYMHGPYLEANRQHCLFFIEDCHHDNGQYERSLRLKNYMASHVGQVYTLSIGDVAQPNINTLNINMKLDHHFTPLLTVIPIQILAYHIAGAKNIDLSIRIFDDFDKVLKSKI